MPDSVLLVDYENIGKIDLGAIPAGVRVPFFFGASQRSVPTEFLKAALKLGERFVQIDIEGQGKNALDFHIAFYLGEYLTAPRRRCQASASGTRQGRRRCGSRVRSCPGPRCRSARSARRAAARP